MKKIRSAALILAAAMTLTLTACRKDGGVTMNSGDGSSSSTTSNSSETFLDKASKFLEADGRGYGKEHTAEIGEVLKNEFFSLKVTEAYRYSSMGDYLPDEGYDFVAVNITVGNIFSESIPVGSYDYVLRWGEGDENSYDAFQVGNLHTSYDINFFPDDTTLSIGASKSGYVIFEAPSDSTELTLEYLEIYEDDFEGNTYHINLGNPEFAADDYKPPESKNVEAAIGETVPTVDFDLRVNSVNSADALGGYISYEGNKLIAAEVTLSGATEEVTVGASMFYIIMSVIEDGKLVDYYGYSIESTDLSGDAEFFPEEVTLAPGEDLTGVLLFEVPDDSTNLCLSMIDSSETADTMYSVTLGDAAAIPSFSASV
ncbi:MAG: DUF4352 domain-containing protein [Oscillospiraceae bacterium]|nr:DUF4352 domain-containing protein [Oscillospiraceae bacterium]